MVKIFSLPLIIILYSCASRGLTIDPMQPTVSFDTTAIIEACGNQPIVGFTYCRVGEGESTSDALNFIGPPVECNQRDSCIFIKVWNAQGKLAWSGSILKGQTKVAISWKTLVSSPSFEIQQRGFWTWNLEVHYFDEKKRERISKTNGDIVLRIYRRDYLPLVSDGADPAIIWTWSDGDCHYKLTSSLRAYVSCGNL